MTTETITAEQLEAAELGTTIICGVNGPADRITEVVAVKAGTISRDDADPWMAHGSLRDSTGRRWWSSSRLASSLTTDARLLYPALAESPRDKPVAAASHPLDEWLAMDGAQVAARVESMRVGDLRQLRELIAAEREAEAERQRRAQQQHGVLGTLESRIISSAAI